MDWHQNSIIQLSKFVFIVFLLHIPVSHAAERFVVDTANYKTELTKILSNNFQDFSVHFRSGNYRFPKPLVIAGRDISIQGNGEVEFSFSDIDAKQSMLVVGQNIQVSGIKIISASGDGLVIRQSENIQIENITLDWAPEVCGMNGYGLYPVLSNNIHITKEFINKASRLCVKAGWSREEA